MTAYDLTRVDVTFRLPRVTYEKFVEATGGEAKKGYRDSQLELLILQWLLKECRCGEECKACGICKRAKMCDTCTHTLPEEL